MADGNERYEQEKSELAAEAAETPANTEDLVELAAETMPLADVEAIADAEDQSDYE